MLENVRKWVGGKLADMAAAIFPGSPDAVQTDPEPPIRKPDPNKVTLVYDVNVQGQMVFTIVGHMPDELRKGFLREFKVALLAHLVTEKHMYDKDCTPRFVGNDPNSLIITTNAFADNHVMVLPAYYPDAQKQLLSTRQRITNFAARWAENMEHDFIDQTPESLTRDYDAVETAPGPRQGLS